MIESIAALDKPTTDARERTATFIVETVERTAIHIAIAKDSGQIEPDAAEKLFNMLSYVVERAGEDKENILSNKVCGELDEKIFEATGAKLNQPRP